MSKAEKGVIVYKDARDPDWWPVEYLLPCDEMPDQVRDYLHPCFGQMVGLSPSEVESILLDRWSAIRDPSVAQLRRVAMDHRPKSIVHWRGQAWVVLEKPFLNGMPDRYPMNYAEGILMVPPPVEEDVINEGIERTQCPDSTQFREFVRHFGGCRDYMPDHAGHYPIPEKWETIFDFWGEADYPTWSREWQRALVVYHSSVGDFILMHPNGKVAWSLFAEGELWPLADSFQGFLQFLVNHQALVGLDKYRGEPL